MSGGALASNSFNLWSSGYFTGGNVSSLDVAYFATNAGGTELWTSGPMGVQESNVGSNGQNTLDWIENAYWAYANEATLATDAAWYEKANSDSYYYTMDHNWNGKGTNPGTGNFGAFYSTGQWRGNAGEQWERVPGYLRLDRPDQHSQASTFRNAHYLSRCQRQYHHHRRPDRNRHSNSAKRAASRLGTSRVGRNQEKRHLQFLTRSTIT